MKCVLKTGPASPAVRYQDFLARTRITHHRDDGVIEQLLKEAQEEAEGYLQRKLITQTWTMYWDRFEDPLVLRYPPVQSVTHVKYLDSDGDAQTLSEDVWEEGRLNGLYVVRRKYDQIWETPQSHEDAVWAEYIVGYGDKPDDVPFRIGAAIRLHAAWRYRHRESQEIPQAFFNYLRPLRAARFATSGQA